MKQNKSKKNSAKKIIVIEIILLLTLPIGFLVLYLGGFILVPSSVKLAYNQTQGYGDQNEIITIAACHKNTNVIYRVKVSYSYGSSTEYFSDKGKSLGTYEETDSLPLYPVERKINLEGYRCRTISSREHKNKSRY